MWSEPQSVWHHPCTSVIYVLICLSEGPNLVSLWRSFWWVPAVAWRDEGFFGELTIDVSKNPSCSPLSVSHSKKTCLAVLSSGYTRKRHIGSLLLQSQPSMVKVTHGKILHIVIWIYYFYIIIICQAIFRAGSVGPLCMCEEGGRRDLPKVAHHLCVEEVAHSRQYSMPILCGGWTTKGSPAHPLYICIPFIAPRRPE